MQNLVVNPVVVTSEGEVNRIVTDVHLDRPDIHRLRLFDQGRPLAVMSLPIDDAVGMEPYFFYVKTWGEHGVFFEALRDREILCPTGEVRPVQDYGDALRCDLNLAKINTRFNCSLCNRTFPSTKAKCWPETRELCCPDCVRIADGDVLGSGVDVDDRLFDDSKYKRRTR